MTGETMECYGKMFPPVTQPGHNTTVKAKVLGYTIEHPGIMTTGTSICADQAAWRGCQACPEYESCYRLSLGKLLLEIALAA
jgi:hypothetical protein